MLLNAAPLRTVSFTTRALAASWRCCVERFTEGRDVALSVAEVARLRVRT